MKYFKKTCQMIAMLGVLALPYQGLAQSAMMSEPVSLDFQDMPVRAVLDVLAHAGGANIVASDAVQGNITLKLSNTPWQEALDIVINSKNLIKTHENGVIKISTAAELAEFAKAQSQSQKQAEAVLPMQMAYVRLNYADAKDVLALLGGQGDNGKMGLLSERGTATMDKRTNTLIVHDTSPRVEQIKGLITHLDVPVKQVMIEARIVSANDGFSRDLGVNFGVLSNSKHLQIGGSHTTLWDMRTTDISKNPVSRPDNLSINLGATNPVGRIAFGLINMPDVLLDLELSAMQADRRGEVISTPKVLTADKQMARISSGVQIAYQEETSSGATNTVFKEAALVLEATPTITPDGKITLKLNVKNGSPISHLGAIAIQEDALETNVVVDNGQTVVLGGIYRQSNQNTVTKVPFFGDLPWVGKLFRQENKENRKDELLIFVTPKLLD